ncbi:MAG: 4-alpha-glucanotransferase, partial [Acidobacteriaceae bacterium]
VVYTGTHDNPTTRSWFEDLPGEQQTRIWNYLERHGAKSANAATSLIELAWSSIADLAMAPLQDLLNLGKEARMNVPGRPDGNWRWRASGEMLSDSRFEWLRDLTRKASRAV